MVSQKKVFFRNWHKDDIFVIIMGIKSFVKINTFLGMSSNVKKCCETVPGDYSFF